MLASLDELLEDLRRLVQRGRRANLYLQGRNRHVREKLGLTAEKIFWAKKMRKRQEARKLVQDRRRRKKEHDNGLR